MTEGRSRIPEGETDTGGRRVTVVFYLAFALMLSVTVAVLPIVADTHRLSGAWITFCAAIGID
jgi:hypothetical protein